MQKSATTVNPMPSVKRDRPKPELRSKYSNRKKDLLRQRYVEQQTLRLITQKETEMQRHATKDAKPAREREEEFRMKNERSKSIALLHEDEKRKNLTAWIRSVPLSQDCIDRIRAFSDGCLLAEVIMHHFCPNICEKRNHHRTYPAQNSSHPMMQKSHSISVNPSSSAKGTPKPELNNKSYSNNNNNNNKKKEKELMRQQTHQQHDKEAAKRAAEEEERKHHTSKEAKERAQREEEHKLKKAKSIALLNDDDKQKDLTAWIRSVPLTQDCIDRIDRAFSDGSLLAEVIHHFCPQICDKRYYHRWNSKRNKISNWDALNNKVFPKLGFRLNQQQINNLLNPFACGKYQRNCEKGIFIYKLLSRVRKELAQRNSAVFDYRKPNFIPPPFCQRKVHRRKPINCLDFPPYSKVEMLLEQGFYDKKEKETTQKCKKTGAKPEESLKSSRVSKSESCFERETQFPYSFPSTSCWRFEDFDVCFSDQPTLCMRPTLSCNCTEPTTSRFY